MRRPETNPGRQPREVGRPFGAPAHRALNRRLGIDLAEQAIADCTTEEPDYLLHGDLHHGNILFDDARGWIAIDPKGLVGLGRLEVARSTYHFLPGAPEMHPMQFSERVAILADELEDDRVHHWAMLDRRPSERVEELSHP